MTSDRTLTRALPNQHHRTRRSRARRKREVLSVGRNNTSRCPSDLSFRMTYLSLLSRFAAALEFGADNHVVEISHTGDRKCPSLEVSYD